MDAARGRIHRAGIDSKFPRYARPMALARAVPDGVTRRVCANRNRHQRKGLFLSDQRTRRLLQSVGMQAFVEYYEVFSDSTLTAVQAVERLDPCEDLGGRRVRVNCARHLIDEGLVIPALEMIAASKRVDAATSRGAARILASLRTA